MGRARALVVERDPKARTAILQALEKHGLVVVDLTADGDLIEALRRHPVDLVFLDLDGVEETGRQLLREAVELRPAPMVAGLLSGVTEDRVESLLQQGLFDVVGRPVDPKALAVVIRRAQRELALREQLARFRDALQRQEGYRGLVGHSATIESLRGQLVRLAAGELPVWFHGEEGSGKELAGRVLHDRSAHASGEFVVVDCAAVAGSRAEQRWLARAPDGQDEPLWKQARGGSLFLDEIGELSAEGQQALLALIEHLDASPATRVRLMAASKRDPRRLVDRGQLADGLYRRLAETTLSVPPLRERAEDIPLLVRSFLGTIVEINQLGALSVSPEAMRLLERYPWPGNVQELRNAVEHGAILATEGQIQAADLPDRVREAQAGGPAAVPRRQFASRRFRDVKREVVESFERAYLYDLMDQHGGNVTSAAGQAGMLRSALQRLLRKYGLKSVEFRRRARARHARANIPPPVD